MKMNYKQKSETERELLDVLSELESDLYYTISRLKKDIDYEEIEGLCVELDHLLELTSDIVKREIQNISKNVNLFLIKS